ncbi:gamma-glutamyl-gamma-aminobutyrate hydrolase family protein [Dokdonella fugitiva]|jgi:putative glutamine amidotransferase|uniref:gamma-glutamyl-gamma-aminobutyrate hydrolase family protein n=1 Tax=Dokdonella fugitiva TaxID=328517 RepID=UPI0015FC5720|nr:gamma-glutamyl-gamma-aminobutyrate hydrolase family protein [Dokdonella fugitiva]MBA8882782.1 putative glutamine amidotransferase [Dokdonella fugitiva]
MSAPDTVPATRIAVAPRLFGGDASAGGGWTRQQLFFERTLLERLADAGALVVGTGLAKDGARAAAAARAYAHWCDGLLLQGGTNLARSPDDLTPLDRARDGFEFALLDAFRTLGKPVLGICRGAQLVNVACGGSLRDLDPVEARRHSDPSAYAAHQHAVSFSDGGLLARLHAAAGGLVCSAHRQAVARVGDGLVVEATCVEDGVVEAVRAREEPLLLGVQWHPEFDHRADGRIDGALLLRHFVDAARRDEGAR